MNLSNLPEVLFAVKDPQQIEADLINAYESGSGISLGSADPRRLIFKVIADAITRVDSTFDYSAKMNLLAYSENDFTDHIGAMLNVERLEASKARTTMRVKLSAVNNFPVVIKAGTRVTKEGSNLYFKTIETITIPSGDTQKDFIVECEESGTIGNGYLPGEINKLVDFIDKNAYIQSISNLETTIGGAEKEDNDSFKARIQLAPESFTTAGSEGAYEFHAKSVDSDIADVGAIKPEPGKVLITVILKNGELPNEAILQKVLNKLSQKTIRPLTDYVMVEAPKKVNYDIDLIWYISTDDLIFKNDIEVKINNAIQEFTIWQKSKIGRDVNPTELIHLLKKAGAKRVDLKAPVYVAVEKKTSIAIENNINVSYGGAEDE